MIKDALKKLLLKKSLTKKEAYGAMKDIMSGNVTSAVLGSYLTALAIKGESVEEIAGSALAMRDAALSFVARPERIVDTCGTGGDGKGGLNISTAAGIVVAGAGWAVAKHGNRSISSKSGSADVLEVLGVRIDCPSVCMEDALNRAGFCFMFAPNFHPAMKHAMPTRKELNFRTIFNVLGPLSNPAKANVQLIGAFDLKLLPVMAHVLKEMGHKGGLAVHSQGWDEVTLSGKTHVYELLNGKVRTYTLTNKDFGLPVVAHKNLVAGEAIQNAQVISDILSGQKIPARHVVVANAAAALWIAERAYGNKKFSLKDAVKQAEHSIDSGEAAKKLKAMAEISHSLD